MIAPEEAWQRLLPHLAPLPAVRLARGAAAGRVLAAPLQATVDVPAADVSAMDGYALAGDHPAGARLAVAGTVAAGEPPGRRLPPGQALRVMTGAPMPLGADRVVPVEGTDGGDREVAVHAPTAAGAHLRRRGEVLRAGAPLLAAGAPLGPGALALLASQGHDEVAVHAAPRVAVLVTGDEVVPAEREPGPGQLRDSHTDFLLAALAGCGAATRSLGVVRDEPAALRAALARGLEGEALLVTGGVSRGVYDLVEGVLSELAFRPLFDGVAIQPGGPLVAMRRVEGGPLVFGLPGNPASVQVCFWLLVRPALRRWLGYDDGFWHRPLLATAGTPLPAAGARDRFLAARLSWRDGRPVAWALSSQGSHDVLAYGQGEALLRVPAGSAPAPAGVPCAVLPL